MFARSVTIRARPELIDDGIAYVRSDVMPMLADTEGCLGFSLIVDRLSGRCITTSSWESLELREASFERLAGIRAAATEIFGGPLEVDLWEIAVMHRDHLTSQGACARSTWVQGEPVDADYGIGVFRDSVLPALEQLDGFCSASLLVNRETGRSVGTTTWDSSAAMEASRERARSTRERSSEEARAHIVDVCEFELVEAHLRVPELV